MTLDASCSEPGSPHLSNEQKDKSFPVLLHIYSLIILVSILSLLWKYIRDSE